MKYREPYRPLAPSVTVEAAATYFDIDVEAPFRLDLSIGSFIVGKRDSAPEARA